MAFVRKNNLQVGRGAETRRRNARVEILPLAGGERCWQERTLGADAEGILCTWSQTPIDWAVCAK